MDATTSLYMGSTLYDNPFIIWMNHAMRPIVNKKSKGKQGGDIPLRIFVGNYSATK
jgi:hypothetical protein